MLKKFLFFSSALLLFAGLSTTNAQTTSTDEFAGAKNLISQRVSCTSLSEDQLNQIGDYYMELMHPGAAHQQMEQLLGGPNSQSLRQAHIFIARRWYCGDAVGYGMMGMMMGNAFVYPGGMMGGYNGGYSNWGWGPGMMGYYWYRPYHMGFFGWVVGVLFVLLAIAIIRTVARHRSK